MKKIVSILISACMLMTSVSAMAAVEVNKLDFENWVCSGTAEGNKVITAVLYKGEAVGSSYSDVLAVADTLADGEDKFSFNLNIKKGNLEMGDPVTALVRIGENAETKTFKYVSSDIKAEVLQMIMDAKSADEILAILESDENADIFASIGMDVSVLENMPKEAKNNVADALYAYSNDENADVSEADKVYISAVACNKFYKGSKFESAADFNEVAGLSYGDVTWDKVENKDYVTEYMNENGPYKTEDEVKEIFAYAYAYSEINGIDAHGKVKETLKKFEDLLGLDELDYYEDYEDVSDKSSVNKKFVSEIGKNKVNDTDALDDILKKAVNAASESSSSSGGGGGGGSRVSTGSVVAPTVKTEEQENVVVEEKGVFSDINSSHWAYSAVKSLYDSGDINGYEDGTFRPDKAVTREEFVKMMIGSLNIVETGGTVPFDDVEYGKWYTTYVATAWRKGLVNGVSKDAFGLGMNITRQDMATMIYRAAVELGYNLGQAEGESVVFADSNEISDYATEAVNALSAAKVVNGIDGSFVPGKTATRAEVAAIMNKLLALN